MGEPSDESSLPAYVRSSANLDAESNRDTAAVSPTSETHPSQQHKWSSVNRAAKDGHDTPTGPAARPAKVHSAPPAGDEYFTHHARDGPVKIHAAPDAALDTESAGEKPPALDRDGDGSGTSTNAATDPPPPPPQKPPMPVRMRNGSVRFYQHTKNALTRTVFNVLLVFVPIGIAANFAHLKPEIIFAMNAIAIIPLAGLLTHATESVASRLGDTLGALLNVSFGNAVELIIFIIALVKDEIRIVQASLLGSILANLLLILGMAFLVGGLRYREQIYNNTVTQMSACLLSLSVVSLLLPTAFHASFNTTDDADRATLKISRGTSVVLLLVYILYLLFQLKSHAYLYESMPQEVIDAESHPGPLADMIDSSTSSSSSSSSSDTDTTSGSHRTSKRVRKFVRKIRRKSNASSADTHSLPSHVSSPVIEGQFHLDSSRPGSIPDLSRRGSALEDIMSGDEADLEFGKRRGAHIPRIKDFVKDPEAGEGSNSPDRPESPDRKHRRKHHRHRHHRHHHRDRHDDEHNGGHRHRKRHAHLTHKEEAEAHAAVPGFNDTTNEAPPTETKPTVNFSDQVDELPADLPTTGARRPFNLRQISSAAVASKPELRKFLTQNVFVAPPPTNTGSPTPATMTRSVSQRSIPDLRRTRSLPDQLEEKPVAPVVIVRRPLPPYVMRVAPATVIAEAKGEEVPTELQMSRTAAVVMLLVSTGLVALCAEFLVDAIPQMTGNGNSAVSQAFIGLIILPIVGNAAEHFTAVTVAAKNKMDLAIGVAVGSSIQIALFVTPLIVILGWCMNKSMTLYFNLFETVSLFVTAFVVNFLVLDGKSNYLEGTLLIAAYVIIAVAAFFYPDGDGQSALGGSDAPGTNVARRFVGGLLGL